MLISRRVISLLTKKKKHVLNTSPFRCHQVTKAKFVAQRIRKMQHVGRMETAGKVGWVVPGAMTHRAPPKNKVISKNECPACPFLAKSKIQEVLPKLFRKSCSTSFCFANLDPKLLKLDPQKTILEALCCSKTLLSKEAECERLHCLKTQQTNSDGNVFSSGHCENPPK